MSLKSTLSRLSPENRERRRMDAVLAALAATAGQAEAQLDAVAGLIGWLRPRRVRDRQGVVRRLNQLIETVRADAPTRAVVRGALRRLIQTRQPLRLLSDSGMLANEGFFSGISRRLSQRWLPEELDRSQLKDALNYVFSRRDDHLWVAAVPNSVWVELLDALDLGVDGEGGTQAQGLPLQILEALLVVSYRIAAMGLEPELVRNHPQIERYESPFLAQNAEMRQFIEEQRRARSESCEPTLDDRHLLVLLDQCEEIVAKVRRQAASSGASVNLTILLVRLAQHIDRLELLLHLLEPRPMHELNKLRVRIFKQVVRAENQRNSVRELWRQIIDLLAMRVVSNASKAGEQYITSTRSEYFRLFWSATGAGLIVVLASLAKLALYDPARSPFGEAMTYSLVYILAFVAMYVMHFSLATKQPAMTANVIAQALERSVRNGQRMDELITLMVNTFRSQFVAVAGNLVVVVPLAWVATRIWEARSPAPLATEEKALKLMSDVNLFSPHVWFWAALTGVCLFATGLISGYYDNKAVYGRIPQRVAQLPWLRRWLGERMTQRVSDYIERNFGGLLGSVFFGLMLGSFGALGRVFGLPVDTLHVTFTSANTVYAFSSLHSVPSWQGIGAIALGVTVIGLLNLSVSFGLALYVGMRAQRVTWRSMGRLALGVLRHFLRRPQDFFWPPRAAVPAAPATEQT